MRCPSHRSSGLVRVLLRSQEASLPLLFGRSRRDAGTPRGFVRVAHRHLLCVLFQRYLGTVLRRERTDASRSPRLSLLRHVSLGRRIASFVAGFDTWDARFGSAGSRPRTPSDGTDDTKCAIDGVVDPLAKENPRLRGSDAPFHPHRVEGGRRRWTKERSTTCSWPHPPSFHRRTRKE